MNEPESFIERWSRRKREAEEDSSPPPKPQAIEADGKEDAPAPQIAKAEDGEDKPFDLASLPSIESITAETDVRSFLQAGVPEDLKRAALRRAWSADPQIRDFVGLVENGWDFNDPNAMHGFGPIEPSEVARLMGNFAMTPPPDEPDQPKQITSADDPAAPDKSQSQALMAPVAGPSPETPLPEKQGPESPENEAAQAAEPDAAVQSNAQGMEQLGVSEPSARPVGKPV